MLMIKRQKLLIFSLSEKIQMMENERISPNFNKKGSAPLSVRNVCAKTCNPHEMAQNILSWEQSYHFHIIETIFFRYQKELPILFFKRIRTRCSFW